MNASDIILEDAVILANKKEKVWGNSNHINVEVIAGLLDSVNLILDIGSNIGYFSMLLLNRLKYLNRLKHNSIIHLFEPIKNLIDISRKLFSNTTYNIVYHNYGLGDKDMECDIYMDEDNIGVNTMYPAHPIRNKFPYKFIPTKINIKKYDDINIGIPDFIKIDVEGFEYKVLSGMYNTLSIAKKKPIMLIEGLWLNKHPNIIEVRDVYSKILQLGYKVYDIKLRRINPILPYNDCIWMV